MTDLLPRIRSGELEKLDRIVEDGEDYDDDDIAKTITNTTLKYRMYAGLGEYIYNYNWFSLERNYAPIFKHILAIINLKTGYKCLRFGEHWGRK